MSSPEKNPRTLSYLYEIPFFFAALAVLERLFFPELPSFHGVEPHPYWLGVMLFALRYGPGAGLLAGSASAGLFLSGLWWRGERYLFEDFDFYILPGLFIAVGGAVGSTIDRFNHMIKSRDGQLEAFRARALALQNEVSVEQKAHRALEQHVVSQMSSLVTLYSGARALGSLESDALMDGILSFFTQALKADRTTLYLKEGELWVLKASHGWSAEGPRPADVIRYTEGIIGRAGSENKVISLRDYSENLEDIWAGKSQSDAVMAGPLRRGDGTVVGVFGVSDMPFLRFNSASLNLLSLLLDWAQEAIAKCAYFSELKSKSTMDEVLNVYNEAYFWSRARQEFNRSKTYSLPFSILLVSLEGLSALPQAVQLNALRVVSRLLNEACREIDIVAKFPAPGIPLAVLMITATAERARERIRVAILKDFEKLGFLDAKEHPFSLKIGIGSYSPAMTNVEMMIEHAEKDMSAH